MEGDNILVFWQLTTLRAIRAAKKEKMIGCFIMLLFFMLDDLINWFPIRLIDTKSPFFLQNGLRKKVKLS